MVNSKYYLLRNKTYGTYFKTRYFKGIFHYVAEKTNATKLTRTRANKLLNELHHPENFEILEGKENGK